MGQLKNMMSMMRGASNPQGMLQQMMQNNPQYQQAMQLVQQAGGDPKKAFYQMANQMGVNPDEIMGMLK
jgi:hypothetical protein